MVKAGGRQSTLMEVIGLNASDTETTQKSKLRQWLIEYGQLKMKKFKANGGI